MRTTTTKLKSLLGASVAVLCGAMTLSLGATTPAQSAQMHRGVDDGVVFEGANDDQRTTNISVPVTHAVDRRAASDRDAVVAEQVRWRRGGYYYYGRPYGAYYGPRYGGYYYQDPYYGGWSTGYRGYYYGTPRFGYYDRPWGGGVRVGPVWYGWR